MYLLNKNLIDTLGATPQLFCRKFWCIYQAWEKIHQFNFSWDMPQLMYHLYWWLITGIYYITYPLCNVTTSIGTFSKDECFPSKDKISEKKKKPVIMYIPKTKLSISPLFSYKVSKKYRTYVLLKFLAKKKIQTFCKTIWPVCFPFLVGHIVIF